MCFDATRQVLLPFWSSDVPRLASLSSINVLQRFMFETKVLLRDAP